MNFEALNQKIEKRILPFANKMSTQRHLKAIRNTFVSIMPITLIGSIVAIISFVPVIDNTTNIFLVKWSDFVTQNSFLLSWINFLTLGSIALYVCIGVTNFLAKHYKIDVFVPILLSIIGFLMLSIQPGLNQQNMNVSSLGGQGIIFAIIIGICTVEIYYYIHKKNWDKLSFSSNIPTPLSKSSITLIPSVVILVIYLLIFIIFNLFGTTISHFLSSLIEPLLSFADSLPFVILATLTTHIFWFFGVHDGTLGGVLAPIRDGNLSINATAKIAGTTVLPQIFTTPFWAYFVVIGGGGSCLALAILLVRSKSKHLKQVGRIGIIPAIFNVSEPIIFGVPLMLNPIFLIPFLLTSTLNAIIAYICMYTNIIGRTFALITWNMPSLFGAFLSTLDWHSLLLVGILIILDIIVYYPFFKVQEKQLVSVENETLELDKN